MSKPYYNEQYKRWIVEGRGVPRQFFHKEDADKYYEEHKDK